MSRSISLSPLCAWEKHRREDEVKALGAKGCPTVHYGHNVFVLLFHLNPKWHTFPCEKISLQSKTTGHVWDPVKEMGELPTGYLVWTEGGDDGERGGRGAWLALFISPSGVQGGVTQCDGCSPDPQTPADTFNGHRFLSRQRAKKGGGAEVGAKVMEGGWTENLKRKRMKWEVKTETR